MYTAHLHVLKYVSVSSFSATMALVSDLLFVTLLLCAFAVARRDPRGLRKHWRLLTDYPKDVKFFLYNASCPGTTCNGLVPCPSVLLQNRALRCEKRYTYIDEYMDQKTPQLKGDLFKSCTSNWLCKQIINSQCYCQQCAHYARFWSRNTDKDVIEDFETCCDTELTKSDTLNCLMQGHSHFKKEKKRKK